MNSHLAANKTYLFDFEKNFDNHSNHQWLKENWGLCPYLVTIYVGLVFTGKAYMKNRNSFELRKIMVVWNLFLAVFSIFAAIRTVPEIISTLQEFGFRGSICNPSYLVENKVTQFWGFLFAWSKIAELGDTAFIIMRKQKLIFLHWYHHITSLLCTWYAYKEHIAVGRWTVTMNLVAHSFMYTYYVLKASKFRVPKWISLIVTSVQILQMVIGMYVAFFAIEMSRYSSCAVTEDFAKVMFFVYVSFFVLFSHYFYETYFKKAHSKKQV